MLISYFHCKLLKLNLSYKVASWNKLYNYYLKANSSSYNVYSNNSSLLCKVINEKKRLDAEKKDTLSKLLRLEA